MAITLKDVAERAGVSRSAVSRCFTEGASISAKTQAKVRKAADELGYSPNALASSLTTGRTKLIGLVSSNFHNPIFLEIFDRFTRGLQDRGLRPLLVNLSGETDPAHSLRMLRQYSVDAVIVASSTLSVSFAEKFHAAGVPVVHSLGRHAAKPKINVVGIDNVEAGRIAARELLGRGYRSISMLAGPASATSTADRVAGFREVMLQNPGIPSRISYAEAYSFAAGRAGMQALLANDPAEAYFCGDDVLSIGAISAIQSAGLGVPGDIGIIGFNDMDIARWDNINLTTIHMPTERIVEASIEMVVAMLKNQKADPEARLFPCHVVERGTLRPRSDR